MNVFKRVSFAAKLAFGRDLKSAIATMLPAWQNRQPFWDKQTFGAAYKEGYTKNELIFRCVQERAFAAASARLMVHSLRGGEPLLDHPLQRLLTHPNKKMTMFDLLSITVIYIDLAGKAYWEQVRSGAGNTVELWPLRPDRIRAVPDSQNFIKEYEYTVPGLEPFHLPAENVIEINDFDPMNLWGGMSKVQVASRVTQVDNAQTDYLKLFFQSGGLPPGLIKTKKKLIDSDVTDIRRRWRERYGGFKNWMEPAVLDMDAEFQKMGLDFKELGFEVLDTRSEVRICMAMMVAPILAGTRVGLERATYANYRESRTAFWEDRMIPEFHHIGDAFDMELAMEEWDGITLQWDFSKVPVLFQKQLEQRREHRADFLAGGLQLNEYRKYMGLPSLPGKTGDVRVQSLAYQIIPQGTTGQLVPLKNPVGAGDTKHFFNKLLSEEITKTLLMAPSESRSPACRQEGESAEECVSRKIPEIMRENPDMSQDQAVAIAHSLCKTSCSEKADWEIQAEMELLVAEARAGGNGAGKKESIEE